MDDPSNITLKAFEAKGKQQHLEEITFYIGL